QQVTGENLPANQLRSHIDSGRSFFEQGPDGDPGHERQSGWFALRQVVAPHGSVFQVYRDMEEVLAGQAVRNEHAEKTQNLQAIPSGRCCGKWAGRTLRTLIPAD